MQFAIELFIAHFPSAKAVIMHAARGDIYLRGNKFVTQWLGRHRMRGTPLSLPTLGEVPQLTGKGAVKIKRCVMNTNREEVVRDNRFLLAV